MNVRIKPEQLAQSVGKLMDTYQKDCAETVKDAVQDAADTAVEELKATSPRRTGRYARSWTQKTMKESSSEKVIVVHARRYQLTHLLENGHAKRGGGRVAARVHIKPVEVHVCEKMEQDIKKGVSHG